MHFHFMNILISVLSWLLAAGGFLVSVTASMLAALVPRLQAKVPEEAHARYRTRIPPRECGEFCEHQQQQHSESALPSATHAASGRSNSGSADSLQSFDTTHSDRAPSLTPTRRTTSTPPTSLPNSPEYRLKALPPPADKGDDSKTNVIGHLAHVCTQKCSNHASTSVTGAAAGAASSSSFSPVAVEREAGRYEADMNSNLDSRRKKTKRMVSWLKTSSPPSSIQSQSQRTLRFPEDSSRDPIPSTPPLPQEMSVSERSTMFTDDVLLRGSGNPGRREPRRASSLLPFMRFGKSSNRHDVDASALPITMMSPTSHMIPVPESLSEGGKGRKSEPTTPAYISRDLPDVDLERSMRERKRKSSYFGRLKRKSSGKDASASTASTLSPPLQDRSLDASFPTQTQFLHPSPDRRDANTPSPPPSPPARAPKKKRSICEKHRRSRPDSAPSSASVPVAPRRTNPYDAPYYFPTPVSPDAVDYVRRARTEIRRSSVSPSAKEKDRRRRERDGESSSPNASGELLKLPGPLTSPSPVVQRSKSTGARPNTSTGTGAPNTILQGAPPQQGSIVLSGPGSPSNLRLGHRKSASASGTTATAIRVDEFGFVHPVTVVSLRGKGNRV